MWQPKHKEFKELGSNISYFFRKRYRDATTHIRKWKSSRFTLAPLPILATKKEISKTAQRKGWSREEGEL